MGKFILLFVLVLNCSFCFSQIVKQKGKVIQVKDGDTFVILSNSKKITVRMAGIDAPETLQHYGKQSGDSVAKMVLLKDVEFFYDSLLQFDRFGRVLGTLKVGGFWLDSIMVSRGWAWYYDKYPTRLSHCSAQTMHAAKSQKLGLWACEYALAPTIFRRLRYSERNKFRTCFIPN